MNFFLNITHSKETEEHTRLRKINDLIKTALLLRWRQSNLRGHKAESASNFEVIKPEECFSFKGRTKGTH